MSDKQMSLMEFLDDVVEKAQLNVYEYEEFHENKLADFRKWDSKDIFLYGVASGKLDMAKDLRDLIKELMDRFIS
jgi:hypothetical protein